MGQSGMIPFRFSGFPYPHESLLEPGRPRPHPYVPGEQPKLANLVKLNTNENPIRPPRVLAALQARTRGRRARLRLYPDPNADLLKAAVAREFGVAPSEVFVGNGFRTVSWPTPSWRCSNTTAPILFPGHHLQLLPGLLRASTASPTGPSPRRRFRHRPGRLRRPQRRHHFPQPQRPTAASWPLEAIDVSWPPTRIRWWWWTKPMSISAATPPFRWLPARQPAGRPYPVQVSGRSPGCGSVTRSARRPDRSPGTGQNSFNPPPGPPRHRRRRRRPGGQGVLRRLPSGRHGDAERLVADLATARLRGRSLGRQFCLRPPPGRDAAASPRPCGAEHHRPPLRLPRIDQHLRISIGTDGECAALVEALGNSRMTAGPTPNSPAPFSKVADALVYADRQGPLPGSGTGRREKLFGYRRGPSTRASTLIIPERLRPATGRAITSP